MSSKFFTWTKGDRSKHAPESLCTGGMVPIPVECIHIKGFDYSRTPKSGHRRPLPLRLEQSPEAVSSYDPQLDDPSIFQDAAVKSATSLIAVVNDMLRSPLASARLPPQDYGLAPSYGRPRSRTEPPTPLLEAPSHPLVELPGSVPERPRGSYHHSFDGKPKTPASKDYHHERPCESAKRPSHPWLHLPLDSNDETPSTKLPEVPTRTDLPHLPQQPQWEGYPNEHGSARASLPARIRAPREKESHVSMRPVTSWSETTLRENDAQLISSTQCLVGEGDQPHDENLSRSTNNTFGIANMPALHASHEAHLESMVEAHRRGTASLRMYITFLEQHPGLSRANEVHSRPSATAHTQLYTSGEPAESLGRNDVGRQGTTEGICLPRHTDSRETPRRSAHPEPFRSPHGAHCTSSSRCGEIWLECNHLRNTLDTCNKQISQFKETISRMQRSETSLKMDIEKLRNRLLAANNSRMDVQESLHEACGEIRNLKKRETVLVHENEELRHRHLHAANPSVPLDAVVERARHSRIRHCRTRSDVSYQHTISGPRLVQIGGVRKPSPSEELQSERLMTRLPVSDQQRSEADEHKHVVAHDTRSQMATHLSAQTVSSGDGGPSTSAELTNTATVTPPRTRESHRDKEPPSPTSSSSSSSSTSSALGISLPQTPHTTTSTSNEILLTSMTPSPSTHTDIPPPMSLNKMLPKAPPPQMPSSPPLTYVYSPTMQRGETMKSAGESIIELYARGEGDDDGDGWEAGWGGEREGQGGWVEWV